MRAVKLLATAESTAAATSRSPARARGLRCSGLDDRQEGRHGGHRPDRDRLRDRPHGGQPAGVPRAREAINAYAAASCGALGAQLLWLARVVLLVARRAARHRGVPADAQSTRGARRSATRSASRRSRRSRRARCGGAASLLLVFIVFHLLHFTTGTVHPGVPARSIRRSHTTSTATSCAASGAWWVALFYVVAMISLGLHLYHGAWSTVRTLGLAKPSDAIRCSGASRTVHRRSSCGSASPSIPVGRASSE